MVYRADIDGIRALAVLSVIFYHLKLDFLPGGFVGVDVFFVISGYLITGIISAEIRGNNFSVVKFYERRCRRIFPALVVVTVATTVAALYFLMPGTLKDFGQSLTALGLFSTNLWFFTENGYFDGPSELKPLLHTWSLSVEEQFYIVFPLLLLALYNCLKRATTLVVALLLVTSFFICVLYTQSNPSLAFYMPHTRAWELLAGSVLALSAPRINDRLLASLLGICGLLLLGFSFVWIDVEMGFPGWVAALPVVATVMLILAGSSPENKSVSSRLLSLSPVVHIGKLSYSLYLIHWPLVVFAEYFLLRKLDPGESAIYLLVCLILAQLSYVLIENPIRRKTVFSRNGIFIFTLLFLLFCLGLGAFFHVAKGLPGRFSPEVVSISAVQKNPWRGDCLSKTAADVTNDDYCILGNIDNVQFALIGDSHADALVPAIMENLDSETTGIAVFTNKGCRPFYDYERVLVKSVKELASKSTQQVNIPEDLLLPCGQFMQASYDRIDSLGINNVIVHARWALQYFGSQSKRSSICYADEQLPYCSIENNKKMFEKYLELTVSRLADKRVLIVGPVPEHIVDVPDSLGRALKFGREIPVDKNYTNRGKLVSNVIKQITKNVSTLTYVDPYEVLCESGSCSIESDGHALYNDSHHLSVSGSRLLTKTVGLHMDFMRTDNVD